MKDNFQFYYLKIPKKIEAVYQEKLEEIQKQANQTYDTWQKFEINFKILKSQGFKDKFQKAAIKNKRKVLRMEYKSILNSLSILLTSIKFDLHNTHN